MKLNYFTYRITDNRNQQIYFDNISEIIKNFCLHRKKPLFEKKQRFKETLFSNAFIIRWNILPDHSSNYHSI
ncbi:hypothetical protein SMKC032_47100 [Serratia marcescens]|nr:hypothetical protein SMKC032_47100 [Serratia marcescens]